MYRLPGEFGLVRCDKCQLIRLSPRPVLHGLGFYYPEDDYYSYQSPATSVGRVSDRGVLNGLRDGVRRAALHSLGYPDPRAISLWERAAYTLPARLLRKQALYGWGYRFPQFVPGGRALDIGCGNGIYLSFLKHHGWRVAGVDLSATAAEVAKRTFDIDVFVGDVSESPFDRASFDLVVMSHVIEHLPDPVCTLRFVNGLLKPGGCLYVETPNTESFGRKASGPYWYPWETPRHLCLFAPETLRQALSIADLRVTRAWTSLWADHAWEDTYRREEHKDRPLSRRPQLSGVGRLRAALLSLAARITRTFNPMSGDFLHCSAQKSKKSL